MKSKEAHFKGTPISRGIAIGRAYLFTAEDDTVPSFSINAADVEAEVLRYRKCMLAACEELVGLQKQLKRENIVEGVEILDSHLQIMCDPLLTENIENEIRSSCRNAEHVFQKTLKDYERRFDKITDPFFRERFKDIKDVAKRVLRYLKESCRVSLVQTPPGSIIFAYDLSASDVAEANSSNVSAFITTTGGATSHAAIVAKAKGIPYVTNVSLKGVDINHNTAVVIDGRTGDVILNALPKTIERYTHLKDVVGKHLKELGDFSHSQSETYDGHRVRLSANVDMANEVNLLHEFGGHGVGLYRSEFEFLSQASFPSEEEQFQTYKRMVDTMHGLPIVIRTFDIGGDKPMLSAPSKLENNPIMGCRAIRFLLQEKNIFKSQLRAILRTSIYGDVSILFPMVSALSELQEAKRLLEEVKAELDKEDIPFSHSIRVGCMIEVPSAAIIADMLAKESDFLSIGTNDLVQYALAVDRGNQQISSLYAPTHPSVIRLLKMIVQEANHEGIPVTICGEIAADPRFTPLLLGLGVHELSVAPRHIPIIKNAIRSASIVDTAILVERVMELSSASEIQELLSDEYNRLVPDDCFYNC